ncbi:MAG: hypothetical protein LCI00_27465 [Chloroflexi bacterium]|nr:hypothetical protein [Chloroflexota bacterium]MCC6897230.1 hypothetical protein [Anaerolineae bacterium]
MLLGRENQPRQHTFTLHLNDIHELFAPIQHDPFHPHYRMNSGLDEIASDLKSARSSGRNVKLHIVIVLPPSDVNKAELQQAAQVAIARYCEVRIQRQRLEYETRRHNVLHSLQIGLGILAASLGLATVVTNSPHLSDGVRNLLSNALSIFGSVALWSPTDAFLFGLRPLAIELRTYEVICASTFEIQFAPPNHSI